MPSRVGLCRRLSRAAVLVAALTLTAALGFAAAPAHADPDALWTIVNGECVPNQRERGTPAPCAEVDPAQRSAVLKDLVGATQFLLIPTDRVSGIEDPAILAPTAPNYFAAAWRARTFVEQRAGEPLPRDMVSLAINSAAARSQNQLHIHVDCVRLDVREALARNVSRLGPGWAPFPEALAGGRYDAAVVAGAGLEAVDPFRLLADGLPGARGDMGRWTLVVVGAHLADGRPGFVVLAGRADGAGSGHGEDLQDHAACPPPRGAWSK